MIWICRRIGLHLGAIKTEMEKIELDGMLPRVFAGQPDIHSDVWLRKIVFERGKTYLISAESGRGKSSLCAYLYGYRRDYEGEFYFDRRAGRAIGVAEWCDLRRRSIAYLPQDMRLFPELTALENVALKNRLTGHKSDIEISAMFERLGIADKQQSLVGKMSIGQQQRVAIVRTLCQPCDFFLLDEPVSHLDAGNNRAVAELVMEEAARLGAGIIATSVGNNLDIAVKEALNL